MKPLLKIDQISLQRGGRHLLQNVSFDINKREIVTLIGPNGAGKTTLINIILGLINPDSGNVAACEKLRFGYMPQKLTIDPTLPLTALRFLKLAEPNTQLCEAAMEQTVIRHLARRAMQSLSGGETQRLLLARAILRKPNILVLDEPVQGVDVMGQEALYQLITQLRTELNCAILMVSHDLHLVMSATDRVICLNQHICCHGSPETVSIDPAFTALFGTKTALYNHHHDHNHDMHGDIITEDHNGCQHD